MTLPNQAADVTYPDELAAILFPTSGPGTANSVPLSDRYGFTQAAVEDALKQFYVVDNPAIQDPLGAVFGELGVPTGEGNSLAKWVLTLVARIFTQQPAATWIDVSAILASLGVRVDNQTANFLSLLGIDVTVDPGSFDPANGLFAGSSAQGNALIDSIVASWAGLAGSWTLPAAEQTMTDAATVLASNAALIAQLNAMLQQGATNGGGGSVNFSTLPNSAHLPAAFAPTYSGSGTGTYGVASGRAVLIPASNAARSVQAAYVDGVCLTDVQVVGGIWTAPPEDDGLGNRGYAELYCRADASGLTRTYARLYRSSAEIGCYVAGTRTVFSTPGFWFRANTPYFLLAGTAGGNRIYQVRMADWLSGPLAVPSHTEVGTTAQIGAGFRHCGVGAGWYESILGAVDPGKLLYWLFADNTETSTVGSFFRASRTSTSAASILSGDNAFPAGWYDTVERITPDFSYDSSANTLTFNGKKGAYTVTISQQLIASLALPIVVAPLLANSSATILRRTGHSYCAAGITVPVTVHAAYSVYLSPGDTLVPGYVSSGVQSGGFNANTTGTATYWDVSLANNSTL